MVTLYPFAGYEIGPDGTKTKYFRVGTEIVGAKQTPVSNPDEKRLFYHADHLGGTNVITDISGARVQLNEYDPWGKVSRTEGNVDPEKRFTGQILDPESGLYYYGARYYDPELGRFISPDPIVPSPGDPQSLNRYSYVRNNPVKYIDPTGHGFWSRVGNFFKNLFRQPEQLFLAAITGGLSIIVQAIAAGIGGAGGIAFAGIMGGPLAALVAANLPGVSGGLEFLGGAMMLASGNPAGILLMTAGGLSFCKAKGCQIASRVFGFAGAVAGMAWASQQNSSSGSTQTMAEAGGAAEPRGKLGQLEQLPGGDGYYSYSPSSRQYGDPITISSIQKIGSIWHELHPDTPFGVGDISLEGGGRMDLHPQGHTLGLEVDIRPLRSDGANLGVRIGDPSYSRSLTQDLANVIRTNSNIRVLLFDDRQVSGVTFYGGHGDHLHAAFQK